MSQFSHGDIEEMFEVCMEKKPSEFLESLYHFYEKAEKLTEKQALALERIYEEVMGEDS